MKSMIDLIDWTKCPSESVPVIVVSEWPVQKGEVQGLYHVPKNDLQAILELQIAFRKCRHKDDTGLFLDCDGDCIVCHAGLSQSDLWKNSWPNEALPAPHFTVDGCAKFSEYDGLCPAIVQEVSSKEILMFAWTNSDARFLSWTTKQAHYFSRSRNQMWHKGEESGHTQVVHNISKMCMGEDFECLIYEVTQKGNAACHHGYRSCFYRRIEADGSLTTVGEPVFNPSEVYKK